jgi:hypothetical protein
MPALLLRFAGGTYCELTLGLLGSCGADLRVPVEAGAWIASPLSSAAEMLVSSTAGGQLLRLLGGAQSIGLYAGRRMAGCRQIRVQHHFVSSSNMHRDANGRPLIMTNHHHDVYGPLDAMLQFVEETCLLDDAEALQAWRWDAACHGGGLLCCSLHWQECLQAACVHSDCSCLRRPRCCRKRSYDAFSRVAGSMLRTAAHVTLSHAKDDKNTAAREVEQPMVIRDLCIVSLHLSI